jgi:hypothetical protein
VNILFGILERDRARLKRDACGERDSFPPTSFDNLLGSRILDNAKKAGPWQH